MAAAQTGSDDDGGRTLGQPADRAGMTVPHVRAYAARGLLPPPRLARSLEPALLAGSRSAWASAVAPEVGEVVGRRPDGATP